MARQNDQIAEALRDVLISPNVADANLEPANIVDVVDRLARALGRMANPETSGPTQGLEALGKAILSGAGQLAGAIDNLAEAIRDKDGPGLLEDPLNSIADALREAKEARP